MKTNLLADILNTPEGADANNILRSCVHCGFCNATCPTYQLLGDELDGPRGRIYLIKQMLEGENIGTQTQLHLDRCLTCRNCETTCPSGVQYGKLLDIGRKLVNHQVNRGRAQRLQHFFLRKFFLSGAIFSSLFKLGQTFKPLLPDSVKSSIPDPQPRLPFHKNTHQRKVLLVSGCVQPALKPNIDNAARIIFDRLGIECIEPEKTRCCGSLSHHLNAEDEAICIIKKNIDEWWPMVENNNIEAITMTASGCGIAIKEYDQILRHDKDYADRAKKVSDLYKDPAEIVLDCDVNGKQASLKPALKKIPGTTEPGSVAFHPACTFQHGMKLNNIIEPLLKDIGYKVNSFKDKNLCCGSAGTYSITQKEISQQLLNNKLSNIHATEPDIIVTTNIGCLLHLQSGTDIPVKHWLELIAEIN